MFPNKANFSTFYNVTLNSNPLSEELWKEIETEATLNNL